MPGQQMRLYSGPLSMFGAKTEIAALEKGLPVEVVMVAFDMNRLYEPKHPEVARINPKQQVPVLIHGAVELFDFDPDFRVFRGDPAESALVAQGPRGAGQSPPARAQIR